MIKRLNYTGQEGAARKSKAENLQFLYIALSSLSELETQILISGRLNYLADSDKPLSLLVEIRKKLLNYIKYVKTK